jgi:hypothetical protein
LLLVGPFPGNLIQQASELAALCWSELLKLKGHVFLLLREVAREELRTMPAA